MPKLQQQHSPGSVLVLTNFLAETQFWYSSKKRRH